ncbi:retron St85 family effector protein [Vibrio harveyi]|nr:retron St85 family effector protein [Vibrio harveyi]
MSQPTQDSYLQALSDIFTNLDTDNFIIHFSPRITFICGGPIADGGASPYPLSLRERILNYLNAHHDEVEKNTVVAESFSDYFQNGQYTNLLQFEEDIANIASLIVVCLESAGSLVEFGLFCNHQGTSKKLLVYIPEEHYEGVDSFIALGPLAQLKASSENSVLAYPFPEPDKLQYEDIEPVVEDLIGKLEECPKTEQFDKDNTGHVAFLIHDIISLCTPIKKQEIAKCLADLGVTNISDRRLSSLLYLLTKIGLIGKKTYSHVDYFYVVHTALNKVTFGRCKDSTNFDRRAKFAEIKMTFMLNIESQSQTLKKRRLALAKINRTLGEGA